MTVTVIIPTHNPSRERLARTLAALAGQSLPPDQWELLLVDNASQPSLDPRSLPAPRPAQTRLVHEPQLGLSAARRRGFHEAATEFVVLVDDDNVLAPDYLENVRALFAAHPRVGLAGGKSLPAFEADPPPWAHEFFPLLALRDLGERDLISSGLLSGTTGCNLYPAFAPIGAGMAARTAAIQPWLAAPSALTDRRGTELTSGGDNDIVLTALQAGWEVGYFPRLGLTHLIPASRLDPRYLARLNRGIQSSWMRVLRRHDANPWSPLGPTGAALRKLKAWFSYRAWRSPAARIRWQGACGHFDGRVA